MKYVQFFTSGMLDNKPVELLGNDGVMIVDSRMNILDIKTLAVKQISVLNSKLGKGVIGFQVMQGEKFSTAKPINSLILI